MEKYLTTAFILLKLDFMNKNSAGTTICDLKWNSSYIYKLKWHTQAFFLPTLRFMYVF